MSLGARWAVADILENDSATTAVRGDRFFSGANMVPQGTLLPYQVATEVDTDFNDHLKGNATERKKTVRLDHYGNTESQARTMADRAEAVLQSFKGIIRDGASSIDVKWIRIQDDTFLPVRPKEGQEVGIPRIRQEFSVNYGT